MYPQYADSLKTLSITSSDIVDQLISFEFKTRLFHFYLFTPFCSNQWTVFVFEFLSFYSTVYLAVRFVLLSVDHLSIYVLVSSSLFPFTQALNFGVVGWRRQLCRNFFLTTMGQTYDRALFEFEFLLHMFIK